MSSSSQPKIVLARSNLLARDLGGLDDELELYDLADDPGEQNNAYRELGAEGEVLCERTLSFLESVGTPEEYLAPCRKALDRWREVIRRKSV